MVAKRITAIMLTMIIIIIMTMIIIIIIILTESQFTYYLVTNLLTLMLTL